jgi:hypothetical protein
MNNTHPIQTHTSIFTATFEGDSNIPGESFGTEIPVKILTHDYQGDGRSITVNIGKNQFTVHTLEYLMKEIEKHKRAVKAYQTAVI